MTPKFAQYLDPVFMCVIESLKSINSAVTPSAEHVRRVINEEIQKAEDGLREDKSWRQAKYALVCWIDELLGNATNWPGHVRWQSNTLEWDHFQKAEANEHFYVVAAEVADHPGIDDALETFYVCFMLGFRGLYRPEERQKPDYELTVAKYRVPREPAEWANGMATLIARRRSANSSASRDHNRDRPNIILAKPMWRLEGLLWPWLAALLVAGLNVVCYFYW